MARTKISHPNVRARETAGLEARDYEAFIGAIRSGRLEEIEGV